MTLTPRTNTDTIPEKLRGWCVPNEGRVYPKGKCPVCGGPFRFINNDFICPDHLTRPKRVYIQIQRRNIFSTPNGDPFHAYEQAHAYLAKMRAEIHEKSFDLSRYVAQKLKPLRFKNWSEEWLRKKEKETELGRKAPAYLKVLRVYVRKFQGFFGDKDIRTISGKDIEDFYLSLASSIKYTWNIMSALHKLFSDAKKWGDLKGDLPAFPTIELPETEAKTIDLDIQDQIVNSIPDQMDRAFILFTAREMVRPSETRALQWEDVDLKHGKVIIRQHFSLNSIRPATKAKQIKRLPLDGDVMNVLIALPRHLTSPFVFWKHNGKPFSESWARKLWKRVSASFGVDISLYQGTRHSSATEAVNRVGVDATQEFLGHTSRVMTKKYAKVNVESKRAVLRPAESLRRAVNEDDKS